MELAVTDVEKDAAYEARAFHAAIESVMEAVESEFGDLETDVKKFVATVETDGKAIVTIVVSKVDKGIQEVKTEAAAISSSSGQTPGSPSTQPAS